MTGKKRLSAKKTAMITAIVCAALLLGFFLFFRLVRSRNDLSTLEGRRPFLLEQGGEIDCSTEEHRTVIIPDTLEGVMEDYNQMQLKQDLDLSCHLGERCEQYTYELTNYPGYNGTVLITIYVQGREIIAGDVHTTSIDGFMHGIKRSAE